MKGDLVPPHLAQEVLEDLDRQLLTRAAPIAEAEGREAGVVADRHRLAVGDAEDRAEAAVGQPGLATVAHLESGQVEGAAGKTDLPAFGLVDLVAGRHAEIALGIEPLRIEPVPRIEAGRGMR